MKGWVWANGRWERDEGRYQLSVGQEFGEIEWDISDNKTSIFIGSSNKQYASAKSAARACVRVWKMLVAGVWK